MDDLSIHPTSHVTPTLMKLPLPSPSPATNGANLSTGSNDVPQHTHTEGSPGMVFPKTEHASRS